MSDERRAAAMGSRVVLCDECDFDEAGFTCLDCGMWLCEVCGGEHVCDDTAAAIEAEQTRETALLAAWNERVITSWSASERKGGGE